MNSNIINDTAFHIANLAEIYASDGMNKEQFQEQVENKLEMLYQIGRYNKEDELRSRPVLLVEGDLGEHPDIPYKIEQTWAGDQ